MRINPDQKPAPPDLSVVAKLLLQSVASGTAADVLAERLDMPARVKLATKAAIGASGSADLPAYVATQAAFLESLTSRSVFLRLLSDGMARCPLRVPVRAVTASVTGNGHSEGYPVSLSKITLEASSLAPRSAMGLVVVSKEAVSGIGDAGLALIDNELQKAVAAAGDGIFLNVVADGVVPIAASGPDGADALHDIKRLLDVVNTTGNASLYWVMTPSIANVGATLTNAFGAPIFPGLTPTGGTLLGQVALVTDQLPPGTLMLLDASGLIGEVEAIKISTSERAALQFRSDPLNAAAELVSLWQTNSVGLRAELVFGAERYRDSAVAVLSGVNWGDES